MTGSPASPAAGERRSRPLLSRVLRDLVLASGVALVIVVGIHHLDAREQGRLLTEIRAAAGDGLTLDERIEAYEASIRRSVLVQLPLLAAAGGLLVGFACRERRWAWLTGIAGALPSLAMGVAFFVDRPAPAALVVAGYALCAAVPAAAVARLRNSPPTPPECDSPQLGPEEPGQPV